VFTIKVILLHGFNKNSNDMNSLKNFLTEAGYDCLSLDLPLTYGELDDAVTILEDNLKNIFSSLEKDEKVYFVGHSTGGLVIRKFLQNTTYHEKIGRCVLIATPNNGSKLADIGIKFKPFANTYKTIQCLSSDNPNGFTELSKDNFEIAAIAGSNSNLLLGRLLNEENDGRVEVNSVFYPELSDFIILPFGHKDIHHQKETADYVQSFFMTGKFKSHN
jgi:pimeloyl-ACP methyl ester carboxylesterase